MRRPTRRLLLAAALPVLLMVACGGNAEPGGPGEETNGAVDDPDLGDDTEEDAAAGDTEEAAEEDAIADDIEGAGALAPRVQEAIAQLVDDGADPDAIELVVAESVVWPDGSIGCPEPGMMYTQALVEGYRIVLTVDGEEVAFHGAGNDPPFRCDGPIEPASSGLPTS